MSGSRALPANCGGMKLAVMHKDLSINNANNVKLSKLFKHWITQSGIGARPIRFTRDVKWLSVLTTYILI